MQLIPRRPACNESARRARLALVARSGAALLHSAVPLVALVAPVPAVALGKKHDPGEILGVLVAELHRGVESRRSAVPGAEHGAVHSVGDERLRVGRALEVPALVVALVERLKVGVLRVWQHTGEAGELAHAHAGPRGY